MSMNMKGKGKKLVAVIGYGSQGRAIARNLSESGYSVRVGLREGSKRRAIAASDGITEVYTVSEAVRRADCVIFAFPDHSHGSVLDEHIAPGIKKGCMLMFLHALSVHFSLVDLPRYCDVTLVAPHAPGAAVREKFRSGEGVSAFIAVAEDFSGKAEVTAREIAVDFGVRSDRLIETTFRDEAIGDIFGEQAVLCGGLAMLVKYGFETLVEKGHNPDHAYFEVVYQLDLLAKLIREHGIRGMFERISLAARYGSAEAGPRIIDRSTKSRMSEVYEGIVSGEFAERFGQLSPEKIDKLSELLELLTHPKLDEAARKFRDSETCR